VIELGTPRSVRAWANLDLRNIAGRRRSLVVVSATVCLIIAFAMSYAIYRHFGAPRNEYDLTIYFRALNEWRGGGGLYDYVQWDPTNGLLGFTYPPAAAMVMLPMTGLPFDGVVIASTLGIVLAVFGMVLLALRERLWLRWPQLLFAAGLTTAAAFCLQPISQTAAYGQVNAFLALLVMFDLLVLGRRNSKWAGIGIGLATAIKLTPAIFLVYLVVARQWGMLRRAVLTAVAATLLAAVVAPGATWQYFTSLLWDSSRVGVLSNTANQSVNGVLARFSAPVSPDKLVWALCSIAVLLVGLRRIQQAVAAGDTLLAIAVTGFMGVLISPVSWIHHAVWVAPAMVVLVSWLVSAFEPSWLRPLRASSATAAKLRPGERRAARRWVGIALLAITGLLLYVLNTRDFFGLPDTEYAGLALWSVLAGSAQAIWMVTALVFLPTRAAFRTQHLAVAPFSIAAR